MRLISPIGPTTFPKASACLSVSWISMMDKSYLSPLVARVERHVERFHWSPSGTNWASFASTSSRKRFGKTSVVSLGRRWLGSVESDGVRMERPL